jgi:hypothetical protein
MNIIWSFKKKYILLNSHDFETSFEFKERTNSLDDGLKDHENDSGSSESEEDGEYNSFRDRYILP